MTTTSSDLASDARAVGDGPQWHAAPDTATQAFLAGFGADQSAAMHLATVVLGDRLGLFRAMADGTPCTPAQLADRSGCVTRLVEEWLRAQAISGYCEHDETSGTYWLSPAQVTCLADEASPTFVAGGLSTVSAVHRDVEAVASAFRGGLELAWGDHDAGLFSGVARGFRPVYAQHLIRSWIPALDGVDARLRAGGRIADLGCGHGVTALLLAEGYPNAVVAGFDTHAPSVTHARRAAAEAGLSDRVTVEVADARDLPGDDYDLICCANALHEMGDPVAVCTGMRRALADGGRVALIEPLTGDTVAANRTPVGRSFSAASVMICVPSALSQGGSVHLGTMAPDAAFARVAAEAGFSDCTRVAQTPMHRVLQLTP